MDEIRHLGTDLIGDYAEGLLDPAARSGADRHLQSCEACRRELESAQAYFLDMAGLEPHRAPDRFLTRVHDRIAKASPWRRLLGILSSPRLLPVPVAALSVILLGVYFAYISRSALEPETTVAYAPAAPGAASAAKEAAPVPEISVPAAPPAEAPVTVTMSQPKASQRIIASKAAPGPRGDAAGGASNKDIVAFLEKEMKKGGGEADRMRDANRITATGATRLAGRRSKADQAYGSVAAEAEVPAEAGAPPKASETVMADEVASLAMAPDPEPPPASKAKRANKAEALAAAPVGSRQEERFADSESETRRIASTSDKGSKDSDDGAATLAKAVPPTLAYTVKWPYAESSDSSFTSGLADLGIRILSRPSRMVGDWTLEVRSKRIPDLEGHLRRHGELIERKTFLQDGNGEKPIRLKVRILGIP